MDVALIRRSRRSSTKWNNELAARLFTTESNTSQWSIQDGFQCQEKEGKEEGLPEAQAESWQSQAEGI